MISHRSSVQIVNHTIVNDNPITTVCIEVPYFDLLSWIQDVKGVFTVEKKSYTDDFNDTNVTPWEPENFISTKADTLPFQVSQNLQMIWEQLAKATAIGVQALHQADIHESILQKLMLSFIGRQVLLTFSTAPKITKKVSMPDPEVYDWHLPFITVADRTNEVTNHDLIAVSVYRSSCFGVLNDNLSLKDQVIKGLELIKDKSPFIKHIHMSFVGSAFRTNIKGWVSLDELIENNIEW